MIYDVDMLKLWAKCSRFERVFYITIGRYSLAINFHTYKYGVEVKESKV